MVPYCKLAATFNYTVLVLEPLTKWKNDVNRLAKMTTHQVPAEKIKQMKSRYESNVTAEKVISGLREKEQTQFCPKTTTVNELLNELKQNAIEQLSTSDAMSNHETKGLKDSFN